MKVIAGGDIATQARGYLPADMRQVMRDLCVQQGR